MPCGSGRCVPARHVSSIFRRLRSRPPRARPVIFCSGSSVWSIAFCSFVVFAFMQNVASIIAIGFGAPGNDGFTAAIRASANESP